MRMHIRAIPVALMLLLSIAVGVQASTDQCEHYADVTLIYGSGYGWCCGGWGMGCTECVDTSTGDSCVTDGNFCSAPVLHPTL